MEFLDARRLTGPNLLWDQPGSILDVRCTSDEADGLVRCWEGSVRRMLDALGWHASRTTSRRLAGGVSVAISANIDALYAAVAINEWAWAACDAALNGAAEPDFTASRAGIAAAIAEEANPPLLELQDAAARRGVSFLWDDDEASVGLGTGSKLWPARELPAAGAMDWAGVHDVPLALVTGTNGKTTTVRMAAHILAGAGKSVGVSSTEWVAVGERVIERGDWSGPGGARRVLRQPDVDVAILETARGGLLRRGLAVTRADAALITNVAEDHLGDFGSQTVDELLEIKWVVSRALRESGTLIVNADDPKLVERARRFAGRIDWFTLDDRNPVLRAAARKSGRVFTAKGGRLLQFEGGQETVLCEVGEIPLAMGGLARHNVANALAAAALTARLGATTEHIRRGLVSMSQEQNPGRSNVFDVRGYKVLVDFAHNPQAMRAVFDIARALPGKRRFLCFGQAGDRTDELIRELARTAWSIGLDAVHVSELGAYARGRGPGEVYALIHDELRRCGARTEQIRHFDEEAESFDAALSQAAPGDLVILLALGGNVEIREKLQAMR